MSGLLSVMRPKVGAVDVVRAYVGGAQVGRMRENLFTNPSFEATSGTVEVRRNLVRYPNAELAANTGWLTRGGGTTLTTPTDDPHSGTRSYKVVTDGTGAYQGIVSAFVDASSNVASPGTTSTVTASFWVKAPLGAVLKCWFMEKGTVSVDRAAFEFTGTGAWERISSSFTFADASNWLAIQLATNATWQAITFYVDDVMVEVASTLGTYFDGTTPPKVRRNLVLNPSFEVNITGWGGDNATIATSTAQKFVGKTSALVTPAINTGGIRNSYSVTAGITYAWSAYAYTAVAKNMRVSVTGSIFGATVSVPAGVWTRLSVTFTAATTGALSFYIAGTDSTQQFYVDAGMIEPSPTLNDYFDGSTSPTPGFLPAWEGTPNASPSYLYDGDLTVAWVDTPNASESVLFGVGVTSADTGGSGAHLISSEHWSDSGSKSLRVVRRLNSTNDNTYGQLTFSPTPGVTYTILATLHLESAQLTVSPDARTLRGYDNPGGTGFSIHQSAQAPNTPGDHRLSLTYTVDPTSTAQFVRLQSGSGVGDPDVWFDDLLIIEGAYAGDYFDGNTLEVPRFAHGFWTGTPNASTSKQWGAP